MKKFLVLFVSVLLLVGCGNKEAQNPNDVVCSGTVTEGGETYEMKLTAHTKDNKVETVDATMVFGKDETAKQMCDLFNLMNNFTEKEEDKIDVTCDGKSVTVKGFEKYADDEDNKLAGMPKEDFVKYFQEGTNDYKLTCK